MAAVYNCIFSLQNTEKQLRLLSKLDPVLTGDYSSTYVRVLEKFSKYHILFSLMKTFAFIVCKLFSAAL